MKKFILCFRLIFARENRSIIVWLFNDFISTMCTAVLIQAIIVCTVYLFQKFRHKTLEKILIYKYIHVTYLHMHSAVKVYIHHMNLKYFK